jgi:K+-transporting ATPase ATPase B chain
VLFANFAEAMAEGRGKAQADTLRKARKDVAARRLRREGRGRDARRRARASAVALRKGDLVLVEAGELIPGDGEIVEGVASVDESAITGESAPVIRESGGDRSAVTGGTRVLSDWLVVRSRQPGRDLPRPDDRDGRGRQAQEDPQRDRARHPAGGADHRLPARDGDAAAVLAVRGEASSGRAIRAAHGAGRAARVPHPHHHRRPALGHRHRRHGPPDPGERHRHLGRAVEAAGDVDVLLLDKTGTITLGNRQATSSCRARRDERSSPTPRSSPRSPTRRPRAAASSCSPRSARPLRGATRRAARRRFVPFTAQTRMSGVDLGGRQIRKGAADAIERLVEGRGQPPPRCERRSTRSPSRAATPLWSSDGARVLGVVHSRTS